MLYRPGNARVCLTEAGATLGQEDREALDLHVSIVYPLLIALIVMAIVAVTVRVLSSTDPAWVRAS